MRETVARNWPRWPRSRGRRHGKRPSGRIGSPSIGCYWPRWSEFARTRSNIPKETCWRHSLQVFDLACDEQPYDEEFLAAALLHEVGLRHRFATTPYRRRSRRWPAPSPRGTVWLIEHLPEAHARPPESLGVRRRRRMEAIPDFADLMLLGQCDRRGRQRGIEASELDQALEFLRELARSCGE